MIRKKIAKLSRLSTNVVPSHYHLLIRPEINEDTFFGRETINVQVHERTKTIVLNSLDIVIHTASFVAENQNHWLEKIELNKKDEVAVITFTNELEVGAGQLKLSFSGKINDQPIGCYRCDYETDNDEMRQALVTYFEKANCRRAFPCWDEPTIKAKFDLTLVAPSDHVALSNMPVIEETDDPADSTKQVLKFATTPIMSTYSLAFVIGEYAHVEEQSKSGVIVRVYMQPGRRERALFALDMAVRFLNIYPFYPLPKLDLIAFAGCLLNPIETWGLITCFDIAIFTDPSDNWRFMELLSATSVIDALSRQWFGNLMTRDSSNNSWINAAFARFITGLSEDQLVPEKESQEKFVIDICTSALNLDALHFSHPIEMDQPNEVYDEISYWKGTSVVRMLYHYLGEAFKKGIHSYLNKWVREKVITEDLWGSLEEASGKPVRSFMNAWTHQKGYPLVYVTSRQDGSNRVLTLTQEKFSIHGDPLSEKDLQTVWPVPIRIISQGNKEPVEILLENRSQEVVLKRVGPNEWVKLNPDLTSFCRVNYPPDMLRLFRPSILDKSLSSIDRLNIQNDLFALVMSGKIGSDRVLELIEVFKFEERYSVWKSIIDCLGKFNSILEYTDFQELFHLYVRKLLAGIYSKLRRTVIGVNDHEKEQNTHLKTLVRGLLVSCKDPQVMQEANARFESYFGNKTPEHKRDPIYLAVASDCDEHTFESFLELYRETHSEKERIFQSLGTSRHPVQIGRLIQFAMSPLVRSEEAIHAFASIAASNEIGREMAWDYYKKNHKLFYEKFKSKALLCRLVKNLTENFASEDRLKDVTAHFMAHPVHCAKRTVKQSLESIKVNINWLRRDSQIIKDYLTRSSELLAD